MWICLECSNKTRFSGNESGRCRFYQEAEFDEEGSSIDSFDMDYDDWNTEETNVERCKVCGSRNISDVDQERWDEWFGPDNLPEDITESPMELIGI